MKHLPADKVHRYFAGSNPIITRTIKGKRIYTYRETGIEVVQDTSGKYFRIFDTNVKGRRAYLDIDGNIPRWRLLRQA